MFDLKNVTGYAGPHVTTLISSDILPPSETIQDIIFHYIALIVVIVLYRILQNFNENCIQKALQQAQ